MRIFWTILWLSLGVIILWVARQNLNTKVDLHLLHLSYTNIDLVTVIFFSALSGLVFGGLAFLSPLFGLNSEVRILRREKEQLVRQMEEMQAKYKSAPAKTDSL